MTADGRPRYVSLGQAARDTLSRGERERLKLAHTDWITDLRSGAGCDGGRLVLEGTGQNSTPRAPRLPGASRDLP
jgi:excinuclease UvrABC ATPase subunit